MTDTALPATALRLPAELAEGVNDEIGRAVRERWAVRVWERDTSLWTSDEHVAEAIDNRLGWLDVPEHFAAELDSLEVFARAIGSDGFSDAVVCGMGGSSLAPEVLARSFPLGDTGIRVRVLDSTDPQAVRTAQSASDPARTLYLISSKSGTTTETLSFLAYFWEVEAELHRDITASTEGEHFVAITDPDELHGTTGRIRQIMGLHRGMPHSDAFREMFLNPVDVGGRYCALTYVGLVPAALMSLDLNRLLSDAVTMSGRCRLTDATNPGLWLGVAMATLARAGRDKLTFVIEPRIASLGAWLEQLIAESTGKKGTGVVPVVGEPLGTPGVYGSDRVFVRIGGDGDGAWSASTGAALDALAAAGHPVIDLALADGDGLGGEFFRWEFATAICGAGLRVNPFDEPNVTESKENTARLLEQFHHTGSLPALEPLRADAPLTLYGDTARRLTGEPPAAAELRTHLNRGRESGYISIQAYIAPTPERDVALAAIQQLIRDRTRRATTVGYGPRFLHSTGQLHKGGPPSGCFLQLVAGHPLDQPIPGRKETFGTLIDAQALGDFNALEAHELPVLRVHLSDDPDAGLAALHAALAQELA
jgi:glucose-6-phosphate isomerase